jgi:hypothetical protein
MLSYSSLHSDAKCCSFGGEGSTPTHKAVVVLNKVSEERVDTLQAEEFLENNFRSMSLGVTTK